MGLMIDLSRQRETWFTPKCCAWAAGKGGQIAQDQRWACHIWPSSSRLRGGLDLERPYHRTGHGKGREIKCTSESAENRSFKGGRRPMASNVSDRVLLATQSAPLDDRPQRLKTHGQQGWRWRHRQIRATGQVLQTPACLRGHAFFHGCFVCLSTRLR